MENSVELRKTKRDCESDVAIIFFPPIKSNVLTYLLVSKKGKSSCEKTLDVLSFKSHCHC